MVGKRRVEVGGPLRSVAYAYLGLWLLGGTHAPAWRALGAVMLAGAVPLFVVSVVRFVRDRPSARAGGQPG